MILLRLLASKLHEAWELLRKRVLSTSEGKAKHLSDPSTEAEEAFTYLKKNFGKSNALSRIRNEYAFHNPPEAEIENSFRQLPEW